MLRFGGLARAATSRRALPRAVRASRRTFWSGTGGAVTTAASSASSSGFPSISTDLAPFILALVLSQLDTEDADADNEAPWTVRSSQDKGAGAFASRAISFGERLIAERPLCIWPQSLSAEQAQELFKAMSAAQQADFMQLSVADGFHDLDPIRGRRATNGFAVESPDAPGYRGVPPSPGYVFPKIARLNHSCIPNASQAMDFQKLRLEVYAIDKIAAGSEVTIEYVPALLTQTREERARTLRETFGFSQCQCALCTAPPAVTEASDRRREEVREISRALSRGAGGKKDKIAMLDRMRALLTQEGYKSLPEFDDQSVSNAYAVYSTIKARQERGAQSST